MKRYLLYMAIIVFSVLNIKCIPDFDFGTRPMDNPVETVTIKVKEYKTNLPLPGVEFTSYYCKYYDVEFGCQSGPLSYCITDNNGICKCSFRSFEGATLIKSMYWYKYYKYREPDDEYVIQPEAWVNINFKTDVNYPVTSHFFITVIGEIRSDLRSFNAANISNRDLTLFGNEVNKVNWVLNETFNQSSKILNSGSFTLNPKKFENLAYTLTY